MNPQDNHPTPRYLLTKEEQKELDEKVRLAVIKLEGMEHHIPPRKGEYCYFKSSPSAGHMARYVCKTDQMGSIGVDFSVEEPVDTRYSNYHYQGMLDEITVDHGADTLTRMR
jgi:hypothetical protein